MGSAKQSNASWQVKTANTGPVRMQCNAMRSGSSPRKSREAEPDARKPGRWDELYWINGSQDVMPMLSFCWYCRVVTWSGRKE